MKLFVSYTTRDKEITKEFLQNLQDEKLRIFDKVFIDLIHNDSLDKQARVISELDSSDIILLIETKNIYNSQWVSFEIARAKSKQIPIRTISIVDVNNIIDFPFPQIL